jgi:hypothetical protein
VAASLALTREVLVAAAWVHDIGYAPELLATGFHPLDGARYLTGLGVPERVVIWSPGWGMTASGPR